MVEREIKKLKKVRKSGFKKLRTLLIEDRENESNVGNLSEEKSFFYMMKFKKRIDMLVSDSFDFIKALHSDREFNRRYVMAQEETRNEREKSLKKIESDDGLIEVCCAGDSGSDNYVIGEDTGYLKPRYLNCRTRKSRSRSRSYQKDTFNSKYAKQINNLKKIEKLRKKKEHASGKKTRPVSRAKSRDTHCKTKKAPKAKNCSLKRTPKKTLKRVLKPKRTSFHRIGKLEVNVQDLRKENRKIFEFIQVLGTEMKEVKQQNNIIINSIASNHQKIQA